METRDFKKIIKPFLNGKAKKIILQINGYQAYEWNENFKETMLCNTATFEHSCHHTRKYEYIVRNGSFAYTLKYDDCVKSTEFISIDKVISVDLIY